MNLDSVRRFCQELPGVTEDLKWGNDLCFLIGGKMFCVVALDTPVKISIKVKPEEFEEMLSLKGIIPAPYVARYKWVLVEADVFTEKRWKELIGQSYSLVKAKLPKGWKGRSV